MMRNNTNLFRVLHARRTESVRRGNVFHPGQEWRYETAQALDRAGKIEPLIISAFTTPQGSHQRVHAAKMQNTKWAASRPVWPHAGGRAQASY